MEISLTEIVHNFFLFFSSALVIVLLIEEKNTWSLNQFSRLQPYKEIWQNYLTEINKAKSLTKVI